MPAKKKTVKKNAILDYEVLAASFAKLPPDAVPAMNAIMTLLHKLVVTMDIATNKAAAYVEEFTNIAVRLRVAEMQITELKGELFEELKKKELARRRPHDKKPATRKLTRK
jgi:hypothetical protein